ncbi:MAG: hypothetical protein ACLGH3_06570 [Actinomycetota bacterium]
MSGFAEVVIIDASLRSLDRSFTYEIPSELGALGPGRLVRVPFHGRLRNGVIVANSDSSEVRTKPIRAVLGPGIPPEMLSFCRDLSEQTLAPYASALAACFIDRTKAEEDRAPEPGGEVTPAEPATGPLADALAKADLVLYAPEPGVDRARQIAASVAQVLADGGTCIVVTPQADPQSRTALAVRDACGDQVAWLGSDLSPRMRYRQWLRVRHGAARVASGGRGAVLAPMPTVDLIVVDDEAHPALREGRAPRYDTVRAATLRVEANQGKVVAIGVPPSLERRVGAHPKAGRWTLATASGALPKVRVTDPGTLIPDGPTISGLKDAKDRILVLLHRGQVAGSVAERMSRVLGRPALVIDGSSEPARLAEARRPDGASLIIASPVVAEDHHIDRVSDLVILEADAALSDPGYRTAEEVFATWWRVLHACTPRRVIIESRLRENAAVKALIATDPDVLIRHEAKLRDSLGYPPYRTLVRIDVPSEAAARLEEDLGELPEPTEVVGPLSQGDGALAYLIRGDRRTLRTLRPVVSAWSRDGISARIEVDPLDILEHRWRS